jgi:hypothetical protein
MSWNASSASNGPHVLLARAFDLAGNVGMSAQVNVAVSGGSGGATPVTLVFDNEDGNDGYVKAGSGGSAPAVGTLESIYGLAIGRGADGKFNRALLSFDTSSIPDGAAVTSARLDVAYGSAYGDPWSNPAGNTLVVDVHTGCMGGCAAEAADWAYATVATGVAQLLSFSGGSQTSNVFSAAGLAALNKSGRTQLRLRFTGDQTATSHLWIGHGASAKLTVTYTP